MHSRLHFYRHDFSIDRDIVKIAEVEATVEPLQLERPHLDD
jgi:hypothetical protein